MAKADLLAIINPHSGTQSVARKQQLREQVLRRAAAAGYTPDVVLTTGPGHATELAATAVKQGIGRVLAIGGDGTINEVGRALRYTQTAVGIVPIGSGNGLARHLKIPLNYLKAIDRAIHGKPVVIDSGEVNEFPFFCTAGTGFDAYVAHAFAEQTMRGLPTYIRVTLQAFQRYRPGTYVVNGQARELYSLTFANAGQFGNGIWIAPSANVADGHLDLCAVRPFPKPFLALLGWQFLNRSVETSPYWHSEAITDITVQSEGSLLIHADGEPLTIPSGECRVRVLPGSLLVIL